MKTSLIIQTRAFPVKVRDHSTGTERMETIVLTKEQLQACQLVGQSSKELIHRLCERSGLAVLDIGKAEKREIGLNLEELYKLHSRAMIVWNREKVGV